MKILTYRDSWSFLSLFTFFIINFNYIREILFKWFIGWEGVGLMFISIKLIFGIIDPKANAAAIKANYYK
jgi:NADH:ubiquinone oxidoreductase subunit 5 (subunit L)/multisubunit Na+/H+ antiporter MnhA subunit